MAGQKRSCLVSCFTVQVSGCNMRYALKKYNCVSRFNHLHETPSIFPSISGMFQSFTVSYIKAYLVKRLYMKALLTL